MKYNYLTITILIAASLTYGCKKVANPPAENKDSIAAAVAPKDSMKDQAEAWKAFKADANARIQALQDSLDAYDARMKATNPHYRVDMKRREEVKQRAAALKAKLNEPKDEAVGSWGRMKDAIVGGIDTMAQGVSSIVSPSKKK
ncbi:MAG: hypothetical protein Q8916_03080 [Bacteroidota bacterium]|nr:hypothetical protein [Bacteroidota bacterium]MDP4229371.1 hypothetical protein [Bacteroidota bacterium]MDP4235197.1 hypothetical protein [Bacteroidota bacterium]